MELDEEADGFLRQAIGRLRCGRGQRQRPTAELSSEVDINDTPDPASGRRGGTRAMPSNASRQYSFDLVGFVFLGCIGAWQGRSE